MFEQFNAENILADLIARVPTDLDTREGSYIYDALAPAAVRMSELYKDMDLLLRDVFPDSTQQTTLMERFLDTVGLVRKDATKASGGILMVASGTVTVPAGTLFSTEVLANSGERPVFFVAVADTTITGTGNIAVEARDAGASGNVFSYTVTLVQSPISGVVNVTNPAAFSGGSDQESLESMRARYIDAVRNPKPYGRPQDFINWAKAVSGVGGAFVFPRWRGLGTVKVVVTDPNGGAVSSPVLDQVAAYLEIRKVAGIEVSVFTVANVSIDLTISISISSGQIISEVRQRVVDNLNTYFLGVAVGGTVRRSGISNAIFSASGVADFTLISPAENILLDSEQSARLGAVTWQ